jgi:uncharacterized C2H2 Zn-finger protein
MTTMPPLGETFQFQTTVPFVAESTASSVEFETDFPPQSHPDQTSAHSEDRPGAKSFDCKYCKRTFALQYLLTLVLANLTWEDSAYQALRKHEKLHTQPLECPFCPRTAAERKDMNRHLWVHHQAYAHANGIPKDTRECPDCGQEFRRDNLKRHMRRMH